MKVICLVSLLSLLLVSSANGYRVYADDGPYVWVSVNGGPYAPVTYCTPDGGKGSVRCGGANNMACVELHHDICAADDVLPNCCAASPLSADRKAAQCSCCGQHK